MKARLNARGLIAAALLGAAFALAAPAQAGRPCDTGAPPVAAVTQGMALAAATARALDATGEQVVVLARAGQDLSRYGLRWSHLGFAYRSGDTPGAPWRVLHKLNHCGTAEGALYRHGLGEFFLDNPHRYEAAFVALASEAQVRLLPLLRDNAAAARWHEPRYNMVAYPWAQRYQQSNQWVLETLVGAMEPAAATRERAQAWLQFRSYEPTVLRLGAFTRLGARAGMAHVAFDDHPNDKRFSDRIETVTVDSVFAWLPRAGLAQGAPRIVRP
ncbi:MAG: DUF2145 domain-containing protein [Pseudomonadota bacterium]|jgi:hypothetical protein|nr:DUF2145 domain-containing protein [Rubrivivax sp.]MCA3258935.1 DUF2145 domain-containing protein [Rubrivivax sp.]MCZ8032469.1 DUF2145 domain-containing protein [Rubrivivax sp.]